MTTIKQNKPTEGTYTTTQFDSDISQGAGVTATLRTWQGNEHSLGLQVGNSTGIYLDVEQVKVLKKCCDEFIALNR